MSSEEIPNPKPPSWKIPSSRNVNMPVKLYQKVNKQTNEHKGQQKIKRTKRKWNTGYISHEQNQLPHVSYHAISNNLSNYKGFMARTNFIPFLFPFHFGSKEEKWRQPVIKLIPSSFSGSDKLFSSNKFKVM